MTFLETSRARSRTAGNLLPLALLCALLSACVSEAQVRRDTVRKRSAREWRCQPEDVRVRYLGGGVYEAQGCMQRATYMCNDSYGEVTYKPRCILESRDGYSSRTDRPAPPRPPPRQTMPGW